MGAVLGLEVGVALGIEVGSEVGRSVGDEEGAAVGSEVRVERVVEVGGEVRRRGRDRGRGRSGFERWWGCFRYPLGSAYFVSFFSSCSPSSFQRNHVILSLCFYFHTLASVEELTISSCLPLLLLLRIDHVAFFLVCVFSQNAATGGKGGAPPPGA